MSWPAPVRKAMGIVAASLVTVSLGVAVGVFVAGPAAASPPTTTTTAAAPTLPPGSDPNSPSARYLVINGTVDAASDHEIVGSSAFPNYATGAVDNYYSKAHTHVDNSPFAQGTASPADTGPIGQTAAAGNFQQPQYADARWPGGPGKATYGSQGGPYAVAEASDYKATAESSAASIGLSGPSAIALPKGLDGRLQRVLAAWKAKWQGRLEPKRPPATVKTPTATIPTPAGTVTTPTATVPTPSAPVGGLTTPPSVPVPSPPVPSAPAPGTATPTRSLSSVPGDGASLLESSTRTFLDPKTGALVTTGESRLGRVSLGGGQIVLEGIHVSATITNDGTPSEKVAVSVGSASIGGVPVTIDQDGVHVRGQSQSLPYRQASDALNSALKQAGIQLFLVAPEIKTSSCDQTGTTSGGTSTTTTTSSGPTGTTPTTTSSGQTGTAPTSSSCDQTGMTPMTASCGQTDTTPTTTTTTSSYPIGTTPTTTSSRQTSTTPTTTSSGQTGTTPTSSSCDQTGTTPTTSSCDQTGTTTKANSSRQTGTTSTTTTTTSGDQTGTAAGTTNSGEETVTATGLHVVFTQPVAQSGVPAQYAEHILGEVYLDSLAVPAGPVTNLGLDLNLSSCRTAGHAGGKKTTGGASTGGGGSSAGGPASSSSISSTSSPSSASGASQPTSGWSGSGSQSTSGSPGNAVQTSSTGLVSALRKKPLWLLVAYLLWQAIVIGTGASLWKWRRGAAS